MCDAANDKQQLASGLRAIEPAAGPVGEVLIESGFVSEAAVRAVETRSDGTASGLRVLAAMGREPHGRRVRTAAGRARYKLRQQTVEPVFGIIKAALGFRSFRLRGQAGAALEWTLVTLAYNLRRLHRLGASVKAA